MFPSVRRALPGMLAYFLIAAPLLAPQAHAASTDTRSLEQSPRSHTADPRRNVAVRPSRPISKTPAYARRRTPAPNTHLAHVTTTRSNVAFFDDSGAWHQTGVASWYGGARWQGHPTASGERYDQNALTAAHRTLPLGSKVKVQLQGSDQYVIVTINDRPGTRTRIIDLSRGAASALGILDQGVAKVTLSLL
jgi:rare lipoprotein A (peptidoglycan hydrolase)